MDRRGVHHFAPLPLSSGAPFGLFKRHTKIDSPTSLVIYPETKKLRRLSLLDRQPAATLLNPRSGLGTEVIGVRPYRVGDSPRHIHWRSTARTAHLISKEFADESNPGLTLILDIFTYHSSLITPQSKHTPFEYAVKIAASIGDYALRRNFPLYLLADESALAVPQGMLNRFAFLEYLARIQPTGERSLSEVIQQRHVQTYVAVIMSQPDEAALESLSALSHRAQLMVVLMNPASFAVGGHTAESFAAQLRSLNIETRVIQFGEEWGEALNPSHLTGLA
jgi:uncharacterized protein (DUF58 family)